VKASSTALSPAVAGRWTPLAASNPGDVFQKRFVD
jgi:hypothetical protein